MVVFSVFCWLYYSIAIFLCQYFPCIKFQTFLKLKILYIGLSPYSFTQHMRDTREDSKINCED